MKHRDATSLKSVKKDNPNGVSPNESCVVTTPARLYYLDWLRVIVTLSMFFYHSDRFFDLVDWPIQNAEASLASTIHREFFRLWMMPLFFVISGAAVYYSLQLRKAGGFVKERITRILVPLVTVGIFVIAPPQIYLERLIDGEFTGNFFQWYPQYFDGVYLFGGNFAPHGMHLWYLLDLFLFSLILLPLFLPRGKTSESFVSRLSGLFASPWGMLLLFVPLAAVAVIADAIGFGISRIAGGWDTFSYLVFFIYGYLIFSNKRMQDLIIKYCPAYLAAALALTALYLYMVFGVTLPETFPVWLGALVLRSVLAWCWLAVILGFGGRHLNFNNRFLGYANEAVLPFYILHQTIILIIGFFVIQWSIGIAPKYFIIATSSFIAIMAIYELLVRRINVLRFLFGMRLKKQKRPIKKN